jgi:uncharacterized protein YicC (UPF0701 family)
MQRTAILRSSFTASRLVRQLGEWAPADGEALSMDFAERLSLWVNAFDAIALQSAQQSIRAIQAAAAGQPADVAEELRRVRSVLAQAIARDPLAEATKAGYAGYQQRHAELQRQMEQMIGALRDQVRQSLSRVSPGLRQLAALDAMFEQMLAPREQALLPAAAALLERRFEQLEGDRDSFGKDWRNALLAELDLRLEPVAGLVEALANELKKSE